MARSGELESTSAFNVCALEGGVGRHAVNLVAGGQSGCGATWPVRGERALFSLGDPGGRLGVLFGHGVS